MTDPPADRLALDVTPISPLRAMRYMKGLSSETVADHFKIGRGTVHRHELYGRIVTALTAVRYARFYGCSVETLFGYLDDIYERDQTCDSHPNRRKAGRPKS